MVIVLDPLPSPSLFASTADSRSSTRLGSCALLELLWVEYLLLGHLFAIYSYFETTMKRRFQSRGFVLIFNVINHLVRDLSNIVQKLVHACVGNREVLAMAGFRFQNCLNSIGPLQLLA